MCCTTTFVTAGTVRHLSEEAFIWSNLINNAVGEKLNKQLWEFISVLSIISVFIILKATGGTFNSHFKPLELLLIQVCYVYPVGHYEFLSSLNIY